MKKYLLILPMISSLGFTAELTGSLSIKSKKGEAITKTCDKAVVFLEPVDKKQMKFTPKRATVTAKNRQFIPGVLPVLKGTTIDFPNEDTILHNVFSLSKTKKFDLGLFRKGKGKDVTFDKSGLVKVFCNIHKGMVADILILDYPYFSKVNKDCSYKITGLPKGEYNASVWFKFGKGKSQKIKLKKKSSLSFDIVQTKRVKARHKNKFGKSYKKSY